MTGSHEVRGSIPLGSTNSINSLGPPLRVALLILCAYSVAVSLGCCNSQKPPQFFIGFVSGASTSRSDERRLQSRVSGGETAPVLHGFFCLDKFAPRFDELALGFRFTSL